MIISKNATKGYRALTDRRRQQNQRRTREAAIDKKFQKAAPKEQESNSYMRNNN